MAKERAPRLAQPAAHRQRTDAECRQAGTFRGCRCGQGFAKGSFSGQPLLDCGGRAQRRHRFCPSRRIPKAAWRFAPRRSPRTPGCKTHRQPEDALRASPARTARHPSNARLQRFRVFLLPADRLFPTGRDGLAAGERGARAGCLRCFGWGRGEAARTGGGVGADAALGDVFSWMTWRTRSSFLPVSVLAFSKPAWLTLMALVRTWQPCSMRLA